MRVVVPHMLFATRVRRVSDDYFPMTSRDLDPASLPPPSQDIMASRPRRPLPPVPSGQEGQPLSSQASIALSTAQSYHTANTHGEPEASSISSVEMSEETEEGQDNAEVATDHEERQDTLGGSRRDFANVERNSHNNYQVSSVDAESSDGHESESSEVSRHDYAQSEMDSNGMPRALSPEPMQDETTYDTDQSGGSFETTASDTDIEAPVRIDETAEDISTNISFGFNPLSSPNQHLDWQGRFPDVVLLSRHVEREGDDRTGFEKEDYRTFAFEAPTWRELIAYLMW